MRQLRFAQEPELDLKSDDPLEAVRRQMSDNPQPNEAQILEFLKSGIAIGASCYFSDVITGRDLEAVIFLTDGMWVWTNALVYHVEKYHWRLEEDFVAHMEAQRWQVPIPGDIDMNEVLLSFHGLPGCDES